MVFCINDSEDLLGGVGGGERERERPPGVWVLVINRQLFSSDVMWFARRRMAADLSLFFGPKSSIERCQDVTFFGFFKGCNHVSLPFLLLVDSIPLEVELLGFLPFLFPQFSFWIQGP